jgi:hypothetical protein
MATQGHYRIGDLNFSFDGTLKELAHVQEIIREIRQAEHRLLSATRADDPTVYLIYDQDLEGERGTFDKMRLRTYDGSKSYTLDIGVTDNNPLGIYVDSKQNVQVYSYDKGQVVYEIDPDGNRVNNGGGGRTQSKDRRSDSPSGDGKGQGRSRSQQRSRDGDTNGLDTAPEDKTLVREAQSRIKDDNGQQAIGEERAETIANTIQRSGLSKQAARNMCEKFGVQKIRNLQFRQVEDAYRYLGTLIDSVDDLPV